MKKRTKPKKRGLPQKKKKTLHNEPGLLKMSEALEQLVEPYAFATGSEEEFANLIGIGAMAWNMTVLPEEASKKVMVGMIATFGDDPADLQVVMERINALMQRKKKLFPNEDRLIIDFSVENREGKPHLTVISHLTPKEGDAA